MSYPHTRLNSQRNSRLEIQNNRLRLDPPEIHYPKAHGAVISAPKYSCSPRCSFHFPSVVLHLVTSSSSLRNWFHGTKSLVPRLSLSLFLSLFVLSQRLACCILKKRDIAVKAREREGREGKRTGYDECDQSVLKEERKRCVSKRNIGTDRERMEGGGGLKGEKRSLKSCEPLTFVIEFSPSAISVLSSPSFSPD